VTTQSTHNHIDRTPTWIVQRVFDPDVTGQDFSYTIGLHELGHPELHLWASPTDGSDPGDDWRFSMRDSCRILNELAFMVLDGELAVGSELVRHYDQGHAKVTFRIQPPGDRDMLEAFGIAPDAQVLPVAWTLQRKPPGELGPMSPEAESEALAEYAQIVRHLPTKRAAGLGRQLPLRPSFDPEQPFGPRSPIVLARAAQLDGADLVGLLKTLVPYAEGHRLAWPVTVATALAREVGREAALRNVEEWTTALVDRVIGGLGYGWTLAVEAADPDAPARSAAERPQVSGHFRHLVADALRAVLAVEAVGDVADESLLLLARGPWLAGLGPGRTLPVPQWAAGPGVRRAVRKLLRPLTLREWSHIVAADRLASEDNGGENAYNTLSWRLVQLMQTTAAGCPWGQLSDLPAGREARRFLARGQAWEAMVEWASLLAALITHRAVFDAHDVETFAEPVLQVVPDLAQVASAIR
jgi:hypothetical protein